MLSLCQKINTPIMLTSVEGPFANITFVGIVMTVNISSERKQELSALQSAIEDCKCTKEQLLPLIHKPSFTCKVAPVGRLFLCRLI